MTHHLVALLGPDFLPTFQNLQAPVPVGDAPQKRMSLVKYIGLITVTFSTGREGGETPSDVG